MISLDSAILLDILTDGEHADASENALGDALASGPVVVCDAVVAEVCAVAGESVDVMAAINELGVAFLPTEEKAAMRAGEMLRRHLARVSREGRGAGVPRVAADFLIGAHALLQCDGLITRDESFFRDYFKGLKIIVPRPAALTTA